MNDRRRRKLDPEMMVAKKIMEGQKVKPGCKPVDLQHALLFAMGKGSPTAEMAIEGLEIQLEKARSDLADTQAAYNRFQGHWSGSAALGKALASCTKLVVRLERELKDLVESKKATL